MVAGVPISSDYVKVRQLFSANSGDEYILEPDASPKRRVQCTLSTTLHTRSSQSLILPPYTILRSILLRDHSKRN
jgi:hypothetical protein